MAYEYLIVPTAGAAKTKDQTQNALTAAGNRDYRFAGSFASQNGTWIVMEKESQTAQGS
jgi:hypothetical protein